MSDATTEQRTAQLLRLAIKQLLGGRENDPETPILKLEGEYCEEEPTTVTKVVDHETPLSRLYLGFQLRGWDKFFIDTNMLENVKWEAVIKFNQQVFTGIASDSKRAEHIAATHALEYLVLKNYEKKEIEKTKEVENSFVLPWDKTEALDLIISDRQELEACELAGKDINPVKVFNEYCAFKKIQTPKFEAGEEQRGNNKRFTYRTEFKGKDYSACSKRKKDAKAAVCVLILKDMLDSGEYDAYLEEKRVDKEEKRKKRDRKDEKSTATNQAPAPDIPMGTFEWE